MRKIGIITDSVADLAPEVAKEKDIKIIPLKITLGKQTFLDGVDLKATDFYELLEKTEDAPNLTPPNSGEYLEMFESMKQEGYEGAVCLLSSSNIYQNYNAACEARDLVLPFPVMVIDTHTASMSQGFLVLEAAKCADEGLVLTEVVERVWNLRPKVHFYGLVGLLHYLVRSRRIGKMSAYFRALLNIKPIITINNEDGTIRSMAKVKSRQAGYNLFIKKIEEELSRGGEELHVAVVHAAEKDEAEKLLREITEKFKCSSSYLQELTPAIGCSTGPGVIGVNFFVN